MSEQTEMSLEEKEIEEQAQMAKDELGKSISKALEDLRELGLDAMIICSQVELDVEGIWCTTKNAVIRNGLVRLADKTV